MPSPARTTLAPGLFLLTAALSATLSADLSAKAAEPQSAAARTDALFRPFVETAGPGCAVGVARGDALVHAAGYGMANLEYDIPLDADSVFRTGSVSKQFTAMAVALAAEEGLVDLDAGIGTYLPELHESVQAATVRQVLGHVGGLPDYESDELNAVLKDATGNTFTFGNEDHLSTEEFYEVTQFVEQEYLPGTRYQYSNIGYFWLGQIVERVTGQRLRTWAEAHIFGPAGMPASLFNDEANRVVPRRASGYRPLDDGTFEVFETNLDWVGEGGVYTSVNDMLAWNEQYRNPTIGADPAALRATLETPASAIVDEGDDGSRAAYAFGLRVGTDAEGRRFIGHGGSWVAFRAAFRRFPEQDLGYWILCNRPDVNTAELGHGLEAIWLEPASN
ncbi:MAG TPA: serine hydrolase domain-containing protein [Pseudomonadales bacterium]|nr:serine hydrolase domain-containing protein [Pseudomonadales bacterium]